MHVIPIVNKYFRVKCVDWVHLLSTRFPEELTVHLKLFKQSRVRLKHLQLLSAKEVNGTSKLSPKKQDDKKTHRRNKSETDLTWPPGKIFNEMCLLTSLVPSTVGACLDLSERAMLKIEPT